MGCCKSSVQKKTNNVVIKKEKQQQFTKLTIKKLKTLEENYIELNEPKLLEQIKVTKLELNTGQSSVYQT